MIVPHLSKAFEMEDDARCRHEGDPAKAIERLDPDTNDPP